jgi:hypothetical protein
MKKNLFLFIMLLLAVGCSDETLTSNRNDTDLSVENGRLVFRNKESFEKIIVKLSKMDEKTLNDWKSRYSFNSLNDRLEGIGQNDSEITAQDEEYYKFPSFYWNVLNSKGEVKVGDEIFWYNNGARHAVKTESDLEQIKLDPSKSVKKAPYFFNTHEIHTTNDQAGRTIGENLTIGHGSGTYAPNQYQFSYCYNGTPRKYVNELVSLVQYEFDSGGGFVYHVWLYLKIKLEYKGSSTWKPAGEYRFIDINLTVDLTSSDERGQISHENFVIYTQDYNRKVQMDLTLSNSYAWKSYGEGAKWGWFDIRTSGSIIQAISSIPNSPNGSHCNGWANYWYY